MFNIDPLSLVMIVVFSLTVFTMLWRPFNVNEVIPTTVGALIVLITGIVSWTDVLGIFSIVKGASITIISTIMMTIVLESIGFFKWVALNMIERSKGSGVKLYLYTNLLCFFMTMFFNNDGSILITTPIIIHIVYMLKFKSHQTFPYLISGALIATAASAPIAISNISNLIALEIIGLTLNDYVKMMFVPSMVGIILIAFLLFLIFKRNIPLKILTVPLTWNEQSSGYYQYTHPLNPKKDSTDIHYDLFRVCIVIVIFTRASFFALTPMGISIEWIGLAGAFLLIFYRWIKLGSGIKDIVKRTPWHILIFAFNMYVLVYGLKNIGLIDYIIKGTHLFIESGSLQATLVMGILLTVMSNIVNNLPSVMIGTLAITEMNLDPTLVQLTYLANIIGSDIGALLTPIGTLATLIWMYTLRQHNIKVSWGQYFKVTILVIPISLLVSLLILWVWVVYVIG